MAEITVRPLSPERLGDYLQFFDQDNLTDNPHWNTCYCYFYRSDPNGKPWQERSGAENRADASRLISAGDMHGYLAYVDGKVAGWCHADVLSQFPGMLETPGQPSDRDRSTGTVVCFVIDKAHRRQGVASSLLDAAVKGFREQGMQAVEAYTRMDPPSITTNYHGPLSMYLAAGFEIVEERDGVARVRKKLD
jgi:ribosomal protein S18 acetylase RimI-like enzyme